MQPSARYTLLFAAAVCVVCSVFVSASAVLLSERLRRTSQEHRHRKLLSALLAGRSSNRVQWLIAWRSARFDANSTGYPITYCYI